MTITPGEGNLKNIHPESPGFLWLQKNFSSWQKFDFEFNSQGFEGGLGASSAQFLTFHKFVKKSSYKELLKDYKAQTQTSFVFSPSGGDVMSQVAGGVGVFHPQSFRLQSLDWKFDDIGFMIFKTPYKVKTHEHLEDLKKLSTAFEISSESLVNEAVLSFETKNTDLFVESLNSFYSLLLEEGLVCEATQNIVRECRNSKLFLAVKGCGALGADTLFTVFKKSKAIEVKNWCEQNGLRFVAQETDIRGGFHEI